MIRFSIASVAIAAAALAVGCGGQQVDDATLAQNVDQALANDPSTSTLDISVQSADGRVTLSGNVPSEADRERAADVAEGVDDVSGVENQLVVQQAAMQPPEGGMTDPVTGGPTDTTTGQATTEPGMTGRDTADRSSTSTTTQTTTDRMAANENRGFGDEDQRFQGEGTARLPQTATSLPLVALLGIVALLGAAALRRSSA